MNTKLTGKTLIDAGFTKFKNATSSKYIETLKYDEEKKYYKETCFICKDGNDYPSNFMVGGVDLVNYKGNKLINSDDTEVYFSHSSTIRSEKNMLYPVMEGVSSSKITIDDIIDNLGVPTYVASRTSKLEDAGTSLGATIFSYVYVYDDYVFEFGFTYYKNTGVKLTNITYMGKQRFAQPVEILNKETNEYETAYDNRTQYYEHQQDEYLKAIGKK